MLGCGLHIDLVVPDARAADRLQARARLEHLTREHRIRRHRCIGAGFQQSIDNRLGGAATGDLELDARFPSHSLFQVVILEVGINRYDLRHIRSRHLPLLGVSLLGHFLQVRQVGGVVRQIDPIRISDCTRLLHAQ